MSLKPRGDWGGTLNPPRDPDTPEPPVGLGRHDKIALLAPNVYIGETLIRENRDKPWIKVIWPGMSVAGFRFALILSSGSTLKDILRGGPETYKRWWEESVKCRLTYNGQIVLLP